MRGVWNSGYYFLYRRGIFCRDKKAEADSGFGHCARFLSARRNLFLFFVSDYVKIHKKTLKKCENVNFYHFLYEHIAFGNKKNF